MIYILAFINGALIRILRTLGNRKFIIMQIFLVHLNCNLKRKGGPRIGNDHRGVRSTNSFF